MGLSIPIERPELKVISSGSVTRIPARINEMELNGPMKILENEKHAIRTEMVVPVLEIITALHERIIGIYNPL